MKARYTLIDKYFEEVINLTSESIGKSISPFIEPEREELTFELQETVENRILKGTDVSIKIVSHDSERFFILTRIATVEKNGGYKVHRSKPKLFIVNRNEMRPLSFVEYLARKQSVEDTYNGIILWDGGLLDVSKRAVKGILLESERRKNIIFAIPKRRVFSEILRNRLESNSVKVLRNGGFFEFYMRTHERAPILYGQGYSPKEVEGEVNDIFSVLRRDCLYRGYPETLRLAHIYSKFTKLEILSYQIILKKNFSAKPWKDNFRRQILGGLWS